MGKLDNCFNGMIHQANWLKKFSSAIALNLKNNPRDIKEIEEFFSEFPQYKYIIELIDLTPFAFIQMIPNGLKKRDIVWRPLLYSNTEFWEENQELVKKFNSHLAKATLVCGISNVIYIVCWVLSYVLVSQWKNAEAAMITTAAWINYGISWWVYKFWIWPLRAAMLFDGSKEKVLEWLIKADIKFQSILDYFLKIKNFINSK